MPHLILTKRSFRDELVPGDQETSEFVHGLKTGSTIHGEFRRMRNYQFHRKMFALFNFLYEHWEPGEFQDVRFHGVKPEKNFEGFRKDLTILAGFYEAYFRIDGSVRIEAKSISFSSMDENEFEKLYQNIISVGLKKILTNYSKEELEKVVDELLQFT